MLFSNQTILDRHNDIFYKQLGQNLGLLNFHNPQNVLAVMAERKCGGGSRSPGREGMWKWTFTSLDVLIEQVRKRNLRSFEVLAELKCGERNFTSLAVKAERKYGSEASDL